MDFECRQPADNEVFVLGARTEVYRRRGMRAAGCGQSPEVLLSPIVSLDLCGNSLVPVFFAESDLQTRQVEEFSSHVDEGELNVL